MTQAIKLASQSGVSGGIMERRASWRMFCGHYGEQGQLENVLYVGPRR
jgi:hypothetical protein